MTYIAVSTLRKTQVLYFFIYIYIFFLFMAVPAVYGSSRARDQIQATAVTYATAAAITHP